MWRFRLILSLSIVIIGFSLVWVGLAKAHTFKTGNNVSIGQNEKINNTVFTAGRTIDINSEVNGDIFCIGQTITVSGTVHGDIICAGQTVNITGKVYGDIRVGGQTVTVGANVLGNATIGGQSFNLESRGNIYGDVTLGSMDTVLNGSIGRDLASGGESMIINGTIGRNVRTTTKNLELTDNAQIKGNLDYTSQNEAQISEKAKVSGTINHIEPTKSEAVSSSKGWVLFGIGIAWFVYWFIAILVTTMVLVLIFPRALQSVSDKAMPRPWKALLTGFLATIVVPLILILLTVTIIGIPLALLAGLIWFVILILSGPMFAYYLGRLITSGSKRPLLIMFLGTILLVILYFIPIVGFVAFLATSWIGTGMIILELFYKTPKPVYKFPTDKTKIVKTVK